MGDIPILSQVLHKAVTGDSWILMTSQSMEHAIKQGATVYYKRVPFNSLQVNDIIVFGKPSNETTYNEVIVHRIVAVEIGWLVTKGDFNNANDPWKVDASLLIGKVTEIHNP